jgi:hypothetical protein
MWADILLFTRGTCLEANITTPAHIQLMTGDEEKPRHFMF